MAEIGSVTEWIAQLRAGEVAALAELHRRYWPFLERVAAGKLRYTARRTADEEDVAQEALLGFYQGIQRGAFPALKNRQDLLAVLALITARKAAHQIERGLRKKRGGGRTRGESALDVLLESVRGIHHVTDKNPTPEEQLILTDCYEQYLSALTDGLRPYAELYLAGFNYREIATELGCVRRTVERKMAIVLRQWQTHSDRALNEPTVVDEDKLA